MPSPEKDDDVEAFTIEEPNAIEEPAAIKDPKSAEGLTLNAVDPVQKAPPLPTASAANSPSPRAPPPTASANSPSPMKPAPVAFPSHMSPTTPYSQVVLLAHKQAFEQHKSNPISLSCTEVVKILQALNLVKGKELDNLLSNSGLRSMAGVNDTFKVDLSGTVKDVKKR
jgi:hypothetical protein